MQQLSEPMSHTDLSDIDPTWEFEVFFDGDCPLCRREIDMIRRKDKSDQIRFTNIADPEFDADSIGVSHEDLMAEIHGRMSDGQIMKGVEVFRQLYSRIGFGTLVSLSRWPGVRHLLNGGYLLFAKNRLRFTGRCAASNGVCKLPKRKSGAK